MSDVTGAAELPAELPADVRVFVNERGVSVPRGATALDAVRALLPEEARHVEEGMMRLTDSRGLPLDPLSIATGGLIMRTVPVRAGSGSDR